MHRGHCFVDHHELNPGTGAEVSCVLLLGRIVPMLAHTQAPYRGAIVLRIIAKSCRPERGIGGLDDMIIRPRNLRIRTEWICRGELCLEKIETDRFDRNLVLRCK